MAPGHGHSADATRPAYLAGDRRRSKFGRTMSAETRFLKDEAATLELGAELAGLLTAEDGFANDAVVFLRGELGAGKTTLVRGILRELGFRGAVKSPTYTLLEPYDEHKVYHFDFYRIGDSRELDFIGIDEHIAARSIKLIEWPERAGQRLSPPDIDIALCVQDQGRSIDIRFPSRAMARDG